MGNCNKLHLSDSIDQPIKAKPALSYSPHEVGRRKHKRRYQPQNDSSSPDFETVSHFKSRTRFFQECKDCPTRLLLVRIPEVDEDFLSSGDEANHNLKVIDGIAGN